MKKVIYLLLLLLLFGCTEYSVSGYAKSNTDLHDYYYRVGFLFNHKVHQNNLPKKGLMVYLTNKAASDKKVQVLSASSKEYGSLARYEVETFGFRDPQNLYVKNLSSENESTIKTKIKNDTITVKIKENDEIKTILFFGNTD